MTRPEIRAFFDPLIDADGLAVNDRKLTTIRAISTKQEFEWHTAQPCPSTPVEAVHTEAYIIDALMLGANGWQHNAQPGHGHSHHRYLLQVQYFALSAPAVEPESSCTASNLTRFRLSTIQAD